MHNCRMRRKRLIRPTVGCRFVGMIRRAASHQASAHNCRMRRKRLIRPTVGDRFVGMIRRAASHQASAHNCRMRRERLIRPTVGYRFVGQASPHSYKMIRSPAFKSVTSPAQSMGYNPCATSRWNVENGQPLTCFTQPCLTGLI